MSIDEKLYFIELIDEYGQLLSKKQFDAMADYYFEDLSLTEIAENLCISRQGAFDLINKSKLILESYEDKLHNLENRKILKLEIDEIVKDTIDKTIVERLLKLKEEI